MTNGETNNQEEKTVESILDAAYEAKSLLQRIILSLFPSKVGDSYKIGSFLDKNEFDKYVSEMDENLDYLGMSVNLFHEEISKLIKKVDIEAEFFDKIRNIKIDILSAKIDNAANALIAKLNKEEQENKTNATSSSSKGESAERFVDNLMNNMESISQYEHLANDFIDTLRYIAAFIIGKSKIDKERSCRHAMKVAEAFQPMIDLSQLSSDIELLSKYRTSKKVKEEIILKYDGIVYEFITNKKADLDKTITAEFQATASKPNQSEQTTTNSSKSGSSSKADNNHQTAFTSTDPMYFYKKKAEEFIERLVRLASRKMKIGTTIEQNEKNKDILADVSLEDARIFEPFISQEQLKKDIRILRDSKTSREESQKIIKYYESQIDEFITKKGESMEKGSNNNPSGKATGSKSNEPNNSKEIILYPHRPVRKEESLTPYREITVVEENTEKGKKKPNYLGIIGAVLGGTALLISLKQACSTKNANKGGLVDNNPTEAPKTTQEIVVTEIPSVTEAPTEIIEPTATPTAEPTPIINEEDIENKEYAAIYSEVSKIYNIPYTKAVSCVNRAYKIKATGFYNEADIYDIVKVIISIDNKDLFKSDNATQAQSFNTAFNPIIDRYLFGTNTDKDITKISALNHFAKEGSDLDKFLTRYATLLQNVLEGKPNSKEELKSFITVYATTLNGYINEPSVLTDNEDFNQDAILVDYFDWMMAHNSFVAPTIPLTFTQDEKWNNEMISLQELMNSALKDPAFEELCGHSRNLGGN